MLVLMEIGGKSGILVDGTDSRDTSGWHGFIVDGTDSCREIGEKSGILVDGTDSQVDGTDSQDSQWMARILKNAWHSNRYS